MEQNPFISHQPETEDDEDDEERSSKNILRRGVGKFVVEKPDIPLKPEKKIEDKSLLRSKLEKAEKPTSETTKVHSQDDLSHEVRDTSKAQGELVDLRIGPPRETEFKTAEDLESLSDIETAAVVSDLAHERKAELAVERENAVPGSEAAEELDAAIAYMEEVEQTASLDHGEAAAEGQAMITAAESPESEDAEEIPHEPTVAEAFNPPTAAGVGGAAPPPQGPPHTVFVSADGGNGPFSPRFNTGPGGPNESHRNTESYISTDDAYYFERKAQARGLLVGGIVGYLYGRRRGRIKTERRLKPIQKKLEKQVRQLESLLYRNEAIIRQKIRLTHELQRANSRLQSEPTSSGPPRERLLSVQPVSSTERGVAAEALMSRANRVLPERIGHVVVVNERKVAAHIEQRRDSDLEKETASEMKSRVMVMERQELLAVSEKIIIDGASLRQVYETHLISENGLRRIVAEHFGGGDVKRSLKQELIEREIDFERHPHLRDQARARVVSAGHGALSNLLQEAGAVAVLTDARDEKKPSGFPNIQQHNRLRQGKSSITVVDAVLAVIIAVLVAIIVGLLLTRK